MKVSTLIKMLLLLLPVIGIAQETVIDTLYDEMYGEVELREVFKDNPVVRHGVTRVYRDTMVRSITHYKNGVEHGPEIHYTITGRVKKTGTNTMGTRTGNWYYYNYGGTLNSAFINGEREPSYVHEIKGLEFSLMNDTLPLKGATAPKYQGGEKAIRNFIDQAMIYPEWERENDIQGRVFITVTISAEGKAVNHQIERGVTRGLNDEALRLLKLLPDNWTPATLNGTPAPSYWHYPVVFLLQ